MCFLGNISLFILLTKISQMKIFSLKNADTSIFICLYQVRNVDWKYL